MTKRPADIPEDFRRRLFRISGLLELADEELDEVTNLITARVLEYEDLVQSNKHDIDINSDSLRVYWENSGHQVTWTAFLKSIEGVSVSDLRAKDISEIVRAARQCNLNSISQLDETLRKSAGIVEQALRLYLSDAELFPGNVSSDSLFPLFAALVGTFPRAFPKETLVEEFDWRPKAADLLKRLLQRVS